MIINTYLIHHSKVPEAILIQTLEKGTESLAMRRKAEYHLFTRSELEFLSEFTLNSTLLQTWERTQNQPKELRLHSLVPTKRRCSSQTPRFSSSTHPGCSWTPFKSEFPAPGLNFLPLSFCPLETMAIIATLLPHTSLSLLGLESHE